MKKILALILATAMSLSLVTCVAAEGAADFEELVEFNFYYPTNSSSNVVEFNDSAKGTTATPAGNFTVGYGSYSGSTTNDYLTYTAKGADASGNGYISMPYLSHYFGLEEDARLLSRDAVLTFSAEVMAKQTTGAYMDFICLGMGEQGSGIEAEAIVFGEGGKHMSNTELTYAANQWYKVVFEVNTISDTYKVTIQPITNQDGGTEGEAQLLSQGGTAGIKFRGFRIAMGASTQGEVLCVDNIKTEGKILVPSYESVVRNGNDYIVNMGVNKLDSAATSKIKVETTSGQEISAQVALSDVTRPNENNGVNTSITVTPSKLTAGETYNIVIDKSIVVDNKFSYANDIIIPIAYDYLASQVIAPSDGDKVKTSQVAQLKAAVASEGVKGVTFLLDGQKIDLTKTGSELESDIYSLSKEAGSLSIGKHTFEVYSFNVDGSMNYDSADFEVYQDNEAILGYCYFDLVSQKNIGDAVLPGDFDKHSSFWFSTGSSYKTPTLAEGKDGAGDYALELPFSGTGNDIQPFFEPSIGLSGKIKYSFDIKTDKIESKTLYFEIKGHSDSIAKATGTAVDNVKINSEGKLWHDDGGTSKYGNITNWKSSDFIHVEFVVDTVNGTLTAYADGKEIFKDSSKFKSINKIMIGYYGTGTQSVIFDNLKLSADATVDTLKNVTYNSGSGDTAVIDGYIPKTATSISFEFPYMVHKGYVKAELNGKAIESSKISTSKTDAETARIELLVTDQAKAELEKYVNKATITLDNLSGNDVIRIYVPSGENYVVALKQGTASSVEYKQFANVFETKLYVVGSDGLYFEKVNGDIDATTKFEFVKIANIGNTTLPAALFQATYTGEGLDNVKIIKENVSANSKSVFGGCMAVDEGDDYRAFFWNADSLTPLLP